MKRSVTFRLLKTPEILVDGVPAAFPFRKAEALLYYLAVKQSAVREEAASLLWADTTEANALKNLRHAIYTCNKVTGLDLVCASRKKTLILNPDYAYNIDYSDFFRQSDISLCHGEFLQNFYIKKAPEFEAWAEQERILVRKHYLSLLLLHMEALPSTAVAEIEGFFHRYTLIEPFDEQIYLRMLGVYKENRLYTRGIRLYQELSGLLGAELQITPSAEINALYRELVEAAARYEEAPFPSPSIAETGTGPLLSLTQQILRLHEESLALYDLFPVLSPEESGRSSKDKERLSEEAFLENLKTLETGLSVQYQKAPAAIDYSYYEALLLLSRCRCLSCREGEEEALAVMTYLLSFSRALRLHPLLHIRCLLLKALCMAEAWDLSGMEAAIKDGEALCLGLPSPGAYSAFRRLFALLLYMKKEITDEECPGKLSELLAFARPSLLKPDLSPAGESPCKTILSRIFAQDSHDRHLSEAALNFWSGRDSVLSPRDTAAALLCSR